MVGEDLGRALLRRMELHVTMEELAEGDVVEVGINGKRLTAFECVDGRLSFTVEMGQVVEGRNRVEVAVVEGEVTVSSVAIEVRS